MLERTLAAVTGLVALVTATVVAIVATAFALFLVLTPVVGQAGAAAIVAGAFALIVAVMALVVAGRGHHHGHHNEPSNPDFGLVERLIEIAREKPFLSVGAAIAAGIIAIRNPALIATIVAAFVAPARDKD